MVGRLWRSEKEATWERGFLTSGFSGISPFTGLPNSLKPPARPQRMGPNSLVVYLAHKRTCNLPNDCFSQNPSPFVRAPSTVAINGFKEPEGTLIIWVQDG